MENLNPICDCIGTASEDAWCAAAHAMDVVITEAMRREADYFSWLVRKYGPANQD
jgi:hypothetical protein